MFPEHKEILLTVIIGVLLVLFLVSVFIFSIVRFERRKAKDRKEKLIMQRNFEQAILESQIEVQESTFSSLSKELHDNIGQLLSTAKVLLGVTEIKLINPPDTLITASATIGEAISELRSLSKSLNKEWLEQFNLIDNLTREITRINSANVVRLHLAHADKILLDSDKQIILFRIIQEAIQNALKHACATNIYVYILLNDGVLAARIADDGKGFDKEMKIDGVGILNIKYRVKLLGGTVEWQTGDDGSTVHISIPVNHKK